MRHKEFDTEAALDAAMDLFWSQGYEATSVGGLVERLGIARASLYATFGSKQELFQRALDRYCVLQAGPVIDRLERCEPLLPELRALLLRLADAADDPARRGCMVVNAAMERIPADAATTERIVAHLRKDEDILGRALAHGQRCGEIDPHADPAALASFLVVTIQGMRVVGKATADPAPLRHIVEVALRALTP